MLPFERLTRLAAAAWAERGGPTGFSGAGASWPYMWRLRNAFMNELKRDERNEKDAPVWKARVEMNERGQKTEGKRGQGFEMR